VLEEGYPARHRVLYLTGPPAAGKSTLLRALERAVPHLLALSYSELLRDHLQTRTCQRLGEHDVRRLSAALITREDVDRVDEQLIARVERERTTRSIVIDSHPVTREAYGFRVTPFRQEQLQRLSPDVVVALYAPADAIEARIRANAMGRPLPTRAELELHNHLQANLAVTYGLLLDRPVYLCDSAVDPNTLLDHVLRICQWRT
jgi:adenylate kinase